MQRTAQDWLVLELSHGSGSALGLAAGLQFLPLLRFSLWHVYLLAFALGMVTVVDNPTRQTFVTEVAGQTDMANAVALNSAIFNLARIAGPAVAGIIIGLAGTPTAFLINAASYGAVVTGLLLLLPTGLSVVLYTTAANSATQLGTDPQIRGRVTGVYMLKHVTGTRVRDGLRPLARLLPMSA